MKKLFALFMLFICFAFAAKTQDGLGTPGITLDPMLVDKFVNDLPVIKDLGLRIDMTQQKSSKIRVTMEETTQDLLGMGFDTKVWGYKFPGLPATYPGATIVAMKDQKIRIKWDNQLTDHFLPVDASLHMAHPSYIHDVAGVSAWYAAGNVPTVAHLHGGHTESGSDGLPEQWFTKDFATKGNYWAKQQFRYDNDQEAATLWYHDHALGITRLNVYAGLAGFYLLRDENENDLVESGVLPGGDYEIEIVIQDRLFDTEGQLFWPAYEGEVPYEGFITDEGAVLPPAVFPVNGGPTALAEFFGNIILVNGKAWPKLDVEPRKYRLRLLNGSDSRFYILKLDNGTGAGSDNIMVIGTDDGLLESPVLLDELAIAPGERYDVIVDFSAYVPSTDPEFAPKITVTNWGADGPAAGGVIDPNDIASPQTTGKIMQFQVTKTSTLVGEDVTVSPTSTLNSIAVPAAAVLTRQLVLFEGMDEFGRLQPMLGTMADGSQTWSEGITENPANRSTEIWEVYNATGDAHPIHLHLVKFQILNRQSFVGDVTARPQIQHNSLPGVPPAISTPPTDPEILALRAMNYGIGGVLNVSSLGNDAVGPLPHENGWKDTFIVPPGQVGRLIARFDRPGRYVWHCHILSHEDHEMMRPFHVGTLPGTKGVYVGDPSSEPVDLEQMEGFRFYPNPVKDLATLDFVLDGDAEVSFRLYNLDGRVAKSENLGSLKEGFHKHTFTSDQLESGMYIIELKAGSKLYRESIIIAK